MSCLAADEELGEKRMKTYLYVTPFFPKPGDWRGSYGYDFVRAVKASGRYRVEVFVGGTESVDYEVGGICVHEFHEKYLPSNILPFFWRRRNEKSFLDAVRRAGVDAEEVAVCHGNTANYAIYALAAKSEFPRCRSILHHHDLFSFGLRNGILRHCWLYNLLMFPVFRRLHERIDLHVFISERSRRSFLDAPDTGWTRHTVITLLKRMEEKGTVKTDDTGKVKTYTPLVSQADATSQQTKKLLSNVFSGNARLLISNLVDSGEISVKEMEELVEMLRKGAK